MSLLTLLIIAVFVVLYTVSKSVRVIPQSRVGIIQRVGNYHRTAPSGLAILVPFVDVMLPLIDLREQVVAFDPQAVITSDNVTIEVATVVYYQILDAKNATYQINNYLMALEQLTQTTLRNVFGGLTLDQALTSRDEINKRMRLVLDEVTERWGVRVNRVEIKDIIPPKDIQQAMEKQMQAERQKRAAILTAEGEKQAAILQAEGERQSAILSAEGERQAAILRAEGEASAVVTVQEAQAKAIHQIFEALHEMRPTDDVLKYQYIQMLPQLAQAPGNTVWVVPSEISALAGLTGLLDATKSGQGTSAPGVNPK